jgi:mRNA interferase MazF
MATPLRGEVWIVDLGYAAKSRPAVVLSREYGDEDRALITVVPHTTAVRNSKFEVSIEARFLARSGVFMAQGVTSVPAIKAIQYLGRLGADQIVQVEEKVRFWLML